MSRSLTWGDWLGERFSRERRPAHVQARSRPQPGAKARRQRAMASPTVRYTTSPLLASKTPAWRSKFIIALIGLSFCLLLGRAVYIQIIGTDFYQEKGRTRYERTLDLPASRGRILDRNGMLLASSVPAPSIWALPKDVEANAGQRRQLAKLLGMSVAELERRLSENQNFVWLRRQADQTVGEQVAALKIKGINQIREYTRQYPESEASAQVVGFTNVEDRGQEGVELAFQSELAGRNGTRRVIRDRLGRVVEDVGDTVPPADGRDIELALDSRVQFFAYQRIRDAVAEHQAKAGSVVVLDIQTGEVLALANVPTYNPGKRSNLSGAQLRNRALTDTFEPGSTIKPFIAALALQTQRVTPNTVIHTGSGRMSISGSIISDAHPHEALTVSEVIQKSSNVGTVKMAMQMQPREMWDLFANLGFGQKPHLSFPGLAQGRLRPYRSWRPIEQATMSYGYGLSTSLFQIAHAYTVFARGGEMIPMSLIKRTEPLPPGSGVQVFTPQVARSVLEMLEKVTGEGGTAPKAQTVGYSVGGKTGTAYKQEGRGYATKKYRSWFVGVAPINQPRIVCAVMVDEPSQGAYYGGEVAAPVFSQVVQQTLAALGVQPDLDVQPHVVFEAEPESF